METILRKIIDQIKNTGKIGTIIFDHEGQIIDSENNWEKIHETDKRADVEIQVRQQ